MPKFMTGRFWLGFALPGVLASCVTKRDVSSEDPFGRLVGEDSVVEHRVEVWRFKNRQRAALSEFHLFRSCGFCTGESWELVETLEPGTLVHVVGATYVLERGPGSVGEVVGLVDIDVRGIGKTKVQFTWRMGSNMQSVPWLGDG